MAINRNKLKANSALLVLLCCCNPRFDPAASLLTVPTEQSPGRIVAVAFQAQVIGFENSRMP
jgi:hypothetical protein